MYVFSGYFIYLLLCLPLLLYFYYIKVYRLEKIFKNFPTPPAEFLLGNARQFTSTSAFLKTLLDYTKKYGSLFHLKMGPFGHMLVCSDPDFLQSILNNNKSFRKPKNLKFLKPWIGNGLTTSEGERWRQRRKLITPAFHFKILEKFLEIFEAGGDVLVENLAKMDGNQSLDIHHYITRCSLDIICESAMGTKIDVQNNHSSLYFQSVKEMCRIFITRVMSITHGNDILFRFTKDYSVQKKALECLHDYTNSVIKLKRENIKEIRSESDYTNNMGKERKVFLDLLFETVAENPEFSYDDVRDEVNTFMFAGHDTTAAASSFILSCLANHKSVQDKVFKEQEEIFGNVKNSKVTSADLHKMRYLECVLKEGMRLYTPVPFFGRETNEDVYYNGALIPKGTVIIMYVHGVHMNPKYYPDPENFDPGRFEGSGEIHSYAHLPFSAGPRNCIGQKYALLEIKSLIAKVIRNFELSHAFPEHHMHLAAETVLRSLNGVKVALKLR